MGDAWDAALASDRPVVINVKTDPEVPPLPPHITFDEAVKLSKTIAKGDPDEAGMIVGAARQLVGALLPGDHD
jgi:pyruvate dehydrogenase (quinone)